MKSKPKILVFASGTETDGGSGFQNLVEATDGGPLDAEIVGVISNHENGGVKKRAQDLRIPFTHFPKPWTGERYRELAEISKADFFTLSGWLKLVTGLDVGHRFSPQRTINIHPGPPEFSGEGFYGSHVHRAVIQAYERREITHSTVFMQFVSQAPDGARDQYDKGPIFFKTSVAVTRNDDVESLAARVKRVEHARQPYITNLVVTGKIKWDGYNPKSLALPEKYTIEQD